MEQKKVLLIAGAGTLGGYASQELLRMGRRVDVICLEDLKSYNANLRYIRAKVTDELLRELFAKTRYDAIVDFIHYEDPEAYKPRGKLLLENTDQLVFLSSYRVYANEEHPIRETSPRLLEVCRDDAAFLESEKYAIPKCHNEDFLRSTGRKNWTFIRPLISFSHYRLDLVTQGLGTLVPRSLAGKEILLPEEARNVVSGVGWAGNVGKMIARLCCNEKALGEVFTLGSAEGLTWGEVADIYTEVMGSRFRWIPAEEYLHAATADEPWCHYILYCDRLWDRTIDNSKVLAATGLRQEELATVREGLLFELDVLAHQPELVANWDTPAWRRVNEKIDAYLAAHPNT